MTYKLHHGMTAEMANEAIMQAMPWIYNTYTDSRHRTQLLASLIEYIYTGKCELDDPMVEHLCYYICRVSGAQSYAQVEMERE